MQVNGDVIVSELGPTASPESLAALQEIRHTDDPRHLIDAIKFLVVGLALGALWIAVALK